VPEPADARDGAVARARLSSAVAALKCNLLIGIAPPVVIDVKNLRVM
jgi:hypothetical protein